mmetsp:Transcript_11245/g.19760  ORF Transcript_11245/g.19760 Transcript_11245/m.19760 type:complete len:230 (+) Transcript_11245:347-1036(+)
MMEDLHFVRAFLWLTVMTHVGNEVVLGLWVRWLAIGMNVITKIKALQWKCHNGWILLNEKVVIAETLNDDHDIWRYPSQTVPPDLARFTTLGNGLKGLLAVELLKQIEKRYLRDEVQVILEQRLIWKLKCQEQRLFLRLDDAGFISGRAELHLHLPLEDVVDHGAAVLAFQLLVQVVCEPCVERHRILLFVIELLSTGASDCLVKLMGRHEALEIPRIVHLAHCLCQRT